MFNHAHHSLSQSLSVLATVLVVFAQIPLGLCGVRSQRIWGDRPSKLGDVGCDLALVLQSWLVKINYCFSAIVTSLLSPLLCFLR